MARLVSKVILSVVPNAVSQADSSFVKSAGRSCALAIGVALGVAIGVMTSASSAGGPTQTPFAEEAVLRGIDYLPDQTGFAGDGLAFADLDGDGDPDIIALGRADGTIGLYENDGAGFFTDRFETCGINETPDFSGVVAGDYDRDGDLDLYVSRFIGPNRLLRNDGSFQFTDVSAQAGVDDTGRGAGCAWGDYDNDGWLDLYVSNHDFNGPNRLYRNRGNGSFQDMATLLGVEMYDQYTFQASFFDYDRDGDADLYLANSYGQHCVTQHFRNFLFENTGAGFVDVTELTGTAACVDAMCVGLGDFDNNGQQDIYVTDNNTPGNALLMSQGGIPGDATYVDEAAAAGVESFATAWGSVFFDYDNDGWLDLYVCNAATGNRLYRHEGVWPCVDVSGELGVNTDGASYTVATADVENDGDLDLLVSNRNGPVRLYINQEGQKRRWAKFDVIGTGASRFGIGTNVDVRTGKTRRLREVIAGSNYKNQNELILHFGLDDALVMDEISVKWPGGTTRVLSALPTNQTWTLYPPGKLGDADQDGDRDLDDFVKLAGCWTGDDPGALQPGCEMMDYEGDSDVDQVDFDAFLVQYDGPQSDCNVNGMLDLQEILDGTAADLNQNGVIDTCESIPGDLNGDMSVNADDLQLLLEAWGELDSPADLDGNGIVGMQDLLILLSNWQ